MSRKLRVVIAFVIIEGGLAGVWWYLARYGMENPDRVTVDFQQTVGQTMGAAMGAFAGLCVLMFFVAARHDRSRVR